VAAELRREAVRVLTHVRRLVDAGGSGASLVEKRFRKLQRNGKVGHDYTALVDPVLTRLNAQADALGKAAAAYVDCGRGCVYYECVGRGGHPELRPRYCQLATICPDCAARRAAVVGEKYGARVALALEAARPGLRLRLVTAGLRPHGGETPDDALGRCQPLFKSLLRVCYGIPQGKREWAVYYALAPVTAGELATFGTQRKAKAGRRRRVVSDLLRRQAGWVVGLEFGERAMLAHGHALVLGRYVDKRILSRCWRLLTGDSFIVDVRKADLGSVREVLKYTVKLSARTPAQLAAIYRATCGRRRVEAYGCLRGVCVFEQVNEWLRERLRCEECGEPLKARGTIPASFRAMGVHSPPPGYWFKPRAVVE
jgi:hypothetical protein